MKKTDKSITRKNIQKALELTSKIIFNLNKENLPQEVSSIFDQIFNENYLFTFNFIISKMIYSSYVTRKNEVSTIINFIKEIEIYEITHNIESRISKTFSNFLINTKKSYGSNYIIDKMVEMKLIDEHCKTEADDNDDTYLKVNDPELHKKLVEEGENPNEFAKIIRNDDVEKLQEMTTQNDFDFDYFLVPSPYERCSFIRRYISLISYAAFFGSIKYLLLNGSDIENIAKYAIAGGNLEIIHLCEQNHVSLMDGCEIAIKFHQNDVFMYLCENNFINFDYKTITKLGEKCIKYHNYEIFSYLKNEGMSVDNCIINEAARTGNLYLVRYFLKENKIPKNTLAYSTHSRNIELVKYVLRHRRTDINGKDIYLMHLIFVLMI